MVRKKDYLIAANWKMHKTVNESIDFVRELDNMIEANNKVEIVIFPPFTSVYTLKGISNKMKIGAQNIFFEEKGAFTGEISTVMLNNIAEYILVGHSERRQLFDESDSDINKKIKLALKYDFTPILCVGETLEEREKGETFAKIEKQLADDFSEITKTDVERTVIAYEPIWAIGTGRNASPEQAEEVHSFIRSILKNRVENPDNMPIIYGGSVKPENSRDLLTQKNINGVLVGGASLNVTSFFAIIENSFKLANI